MKHWFCARFRLFFLLLFQMTKWHSMFFSVEFVVLTQRQCLFDIFNTLCDFAQLNVQLYSVHKNHAPTIDIIRSKIVCRFVMLFFILLLSFFALSVNALIIHRTHNCARVKLKTNACKTESLAGWLAGWVSERDKQSSTNQNDIIDIRMARLLRVHCSYYKGCEIHCQFTVPHWNRTDW